MVCPVSVIANPRKGRPLSGIGSKSHKKTGEKGGGLYLHFVHISTPEGESIDVWHQSPSDTVPHSKMTEASGTSRRKCR